MVDQLESEIIGIIKNRVESEGGDGETALIVGDLTAATELTALGVDSLGLADIIWDVEQAYGIRIEMNTAEAWSDLQNVGDIVGAIRGLLTKGLEWTGALSSPEWAAYADWAPTPPPSGNGCAKAAPPSGRFSIQSFTA